jgi:hypothetical protein
MRFYLAALLGFVLPVSLPAGAGQCAGCHPKEAAAHAQTRMASAMVPVLQSTFAHNVQGLVLREPDRGYQYLYKKTDSGVAVVSFRDNESAVGVVEWVLGSGAQGQTPIVKSGQSFFESRVSFFPQLQQYGITVGQSASASPTALAALGRPKTVAELAQCLGCHSTVLDSAFTKVVPGVQCENCHPGSAAHATGKAKPINPGKLDAVRQVQLCGTCHRNSSPVGDGQLENVRFQPLRLMKSRCFEIGKVSCTTCHVAHEDAKRSDPGFYNTKCLTCHSGSSLRHMDERAHGDCIDCHMPQVQLHPALRFTDHYIHVVRSSDYPPGRVVTRAPKTRATDESLNNSEIPNGSVRSEQ